MNTPSTIVFTSLLTSIFFYFQGFTCRLRKVPNEDEFEQALRDQESGTGPNSQLVIEGILYSCDANSSHITFPQPRHCPHRPTRFSHIVDITPASSGWFARRLSAHFSAQPLWGIPAAPPASIQPFGPIRSPEPSPHLTLRTTSRSDTRPYPHRHYWLARRR